MKFIKTLFLAALTLMVFSCDSSNDPDPTNGAYAYTGTMYVSNASDPFTANNVTFNFDFDAETSTADIVMEGMVFASAMQSMGVSITLTLDDIAYDESNSIITIEFDEEIPNYNGAPYSSYTFENFKAVIVNGEIEAMFDCSASEITFSGSAE